MRLLKFLTPFLCLFGNAAFAEPITETQLRDHIEILASEDFQGRKPGTVGENKTVSYIATQWQTAGMKPAAGDDGWYAPVTLVERSPKNWSMSLTSSMDGKVKKVRLDDEQSILRGGRADGAIQNGQLVFAGYGHQESSILADVDGKVAILLFSAPLENPDFPDYRKRKQALIDAGAAGILTVIKGKNRWRRTARRFRRGATGLSDGNNHAAIEGLISQKQFERLLRKAKLDARDLITKAGNDNFEVAELPIYGDLEVQTNIREYQSHNVVGKIPGVNPAAGAILYMGHWDHFGECRPVDDTNPDKDRLCNGAVDNASGISLLIETAKRLARKPIDRDVYFLATTAEEQGLLGARAFVRRPSFDINRLVIAFNADTVALAPTGKLIAVVGRGKTDLDPDLEEIAKAENREIDKTDKANAFLKRQDGFVFLEKDIPTFMVTSAFSDQERLDAYLNGRYHDVSDEADDELILGGAVDDANFHVALGRYFGNVETYPAKAP